MSETLKEEITTALFQIHSLGDILEKAASEDDSFEMGRGSNRFSNTLMSVGQLIQEKARFCSDGVDQLEEKAEVTE
jgi:hypothetical protein